jgi:hypothetical protein
MPTLCAPAANERLAPAVWGSHQNFRNKGYWLLIIRFPMKSMTAGLTCVAAYSAFECAKGTRNGLDSCPAPAVIARRVDHASNAAPAWPAAIKPYHIFLCFAVSTDPVNAGFTGWKGCAGCAEGFGSIASASVFTFGSGADGKDAAGEASLALLSATSVEEFDRSATAVETFADFAASSTCGMDITRRRASRIICHLSIARGYCKSVPTRNAAKILPRSAGDTGLLVTFQVVLSTRPSVSRF